MKYLKWTFVLLLLLSLEAKSQSIIGTWKISLDATEQYLSPKEKVEFQKTKAVKKLFYDSVRLVCSQNGIFTLVTYVWGRKNEEKGRWKLSTDKKKMTITVSNQTRVLDVLELSSRKMVLKDKSGKENIEILVLVPAK